MLKKSCKIATANAFLNSLLSTMWPKETIVLVTVVPIFAPIIIGTALSSESAPEATTATTIEVTVELLWTMAVVSKPINRLINGLAVARIILFNNFPA
jgi:ABC-type transport system involved in cytochrome c biogenesis permease component